jgi:putative toxin-antitoxin system antitoxin component (TIGR02293 family)
MDAERRARHEFLQAFWKHSSPRMRCILRLLVMRHHTKIRSAWRPAPIACYTATMRTADLKFAEILAKATELFGSLQEAEHWLARPAIGLNRQRPVDLLATPAGVELVETFLSQIEFGVYV